MASLKTCFKCLSPKPLDEFYKHPAMGDGHLGKCKPCARNDVRVHRAANLDRVRQYDTARSVLPHRVALRKQSFSEARAQHPERVRAAAILGNAVRTGKVTPAPCWVCGAKAEAHHPDYSRPLDVVWLCVEHHRQAHGIVRRIDP